MKLIWESRIPMWMEKTTWWLSNWCLSDLGVHRGEGWRGIKWLAFFFIQFHHGGHQFHVVLDYTLLKN